MQSDIYTLEDIMDATCYHYGVTINELKAKSRKRVFVDIRIVYTALCFDFIKNKLTKSYIEEDIASSIDKDRATINYYKQVYNNNTKCYITHFNNIKNILLSIDYKEKDNINKNKYSLSEIKKCLMFYGVNNVTIERVLSKLNEKE